MASIAGVSVALLAVLGGADLPALSLSDREPAPEVASTSREYSGVAPWPLIAWRSTGFRNSYVSWGAGLGYWGKGLQWAGAIAGGETGVGGLARFAGLGWLAPEGYLAAQARFSWLHTRQGANGVGPDVEYRGVEVIAIVMGLNLSVTTYRRVGGLPGPRWRFALGMGLGF